jgi:molecular chaperone GrpE
LSSHKDQKSVTAKDKPKEATKAAEGSSKSETHQTVAESKPELAKEAIVEEKEVEALRKSLHAERNRAEQYLTSLKYLKAEFENYQKRTAKDMDELVRRGSERLARKLLGVIDDFERTIKASEAVGESSKLLAGVEMILKELQKILKSEGIEKIDAVGKKFNPELHEAVTVTRTDKCVADTIVEELRPGYMFDGRVLRPSMVTVANPPEKQPSPACSEEESDEKESEDHDVTDKVTNKEK